MPVWHILISNSQSYIKHYNDTLGLEVVAVSQPPNSWLSVSHTLNLMGPQLVWNLTGCIPMCRVATYLSNSPFRWYFTKVVFSVPSSTTNTSLNWTWDSPWEAIVLSVRIISRAIWPRAKFKVFKFFFVFENAHQNFKRIYFYLMKGVLIQILSMKKY